MKVLPTLPFTSNSFRKHPANEMKPPRGTLGISGWGCAAGTLEPLTYTRAINLGQNKWKPRPPLPPPPQIKDGKMARFCPSRGFILDLGGMGVCCSILFCIVVQLNFATLY